MEKIWIRRFGFSVVSAALIFCVALRAEEKPEIKLVTVDIEMPIKGGDSADARKASQKLAFEKAIEQLLPENVDPKVRADRIKSASAYIKSFRVLDEKQEGEVLKLKYQCDVLPLDLPKPEDKLAPKAEAKVEALAPGESSSASNLNPNLASPSTPAAPSTSSESSEITTFEVTWKPSEFRLNSLDLMQYIPEAMKATVDSFKLGRGSLLLGLKLKTNPGEARTMLSHYLGPKVEVKLMDGHLPTTETNQDPHLPSGPPAPPQPLVAPNADSIQKN